MRYDLDVIRAMLQQFGSRQSDSYVDTDGVVLGPIGAEDVHVHFDCLAGLGFVRLTNDIRMRYHPDPPTYRITEAGKRWVRAAFDDEAWREAAPELRGMLGEADVGSD